MDPNECGSDQIHITRGNPSLCSQAELMLRSLRLESPGSICGLLCSRSYHFNIVIQTGVTGTGTGMLSRSYYRKFEHFRFVPHKIFTTLSLVSFDRTICNIRYPTMLMILKIIKGKIIISLPSNPLLTLILYANIFSLI